MVVFFFLTLVEIKECEKSIYLKYTFINLEQNTEGQRGVDSTSVITRRCVPLNIKTLTSKLVFTPQFLLFC